MQLLRDNPKFSSAVFPSVGLTASQLVAELVDLGPQDACVIFGAIADRLPFCRLSNGVQLSDAINCSQFFDELAAVAARGRISRPLLLESDESWEASRALLSKV